MKGNKALRKSTGWMLLLLPLQPWLLQKVYLFGLLILAVWYGASGGYMDCVLRH